MTSNYSCLMRLHNIYLIPALLMVTLITAAGDVTVTVDAKSPRWTISEYLTGMHFVYAMERDSLYQDERIVSWMKRAGVGIIRWPGGTAVQNYHWDNLNGIAFKSDSWAPDYADKPAPKENYMDLDEYIAFCRKIGAEPLVGVNLGSGRKYKRLNDSLDEARRLICYCKEKNYRVRHWYIGNECFIGFSPEKYAEYIDRYAEVLKSVDPEIVIVGDWKFGPERKNRFKQTLLIAKRSKHINVMEVHEKWGCEWGLSENNGEPTLETWQREAGIYGGRMNSYIEKFYAEMKKAGKDVQLGFNEWGAQVKGKNASFSVALVKADYLISLFSYPVYSACDWNLNMGPGNSKILITDNNGHLLTGFNPSAQIFEICAPALGKKSIPMTSSDPHVYGFAAKDAVTGEAQVYLLNKHSESVNVKLKIDGAPSTTAAYKMTSFTDPGLTSEAGRGHINESGMPAITLTPLSFNRIDIGCDR